MIHETGQKMICNSAKACYCDMKHMCLSISWKSQLVLFLRAKYMAPDVDVYHVGEAFRHRITLALRDCADVSHVQTLNKIQN